MVSMFLNVDDFGASREANEATKRLVECGMATSVSVMVNMPYFEDAVEFLKQYPNVKVGLHFNITEGNGFLSLTRLLVHLLLGKVRREEIARQLQQQYEKLHKTGLKIAHLDSHEHIHLFPSIHSMLQTFAADHADLRVRSCGFSVYQIGLLVRMRPAVKQLLIWFGYGILDLWLGKKGSNQRLIFDLNWHNHFDKKLFDTILKNVPQDTEVFCHVSNTPNGVKMNQERYSCYSFLLSPTTQNSWKSYAKKTV